MVTHVKTVLIHIAFCSVTISPELVEPPPMSFQAAIAVRGVDGLLRFQRVSTGVPSLKPSVVILSAKTGI
jgi:hypothetical protein